MPKQDKNNKTVFVVIMQRWGSSEDHHYIIGVFKKFKEAQKAGVKEREYRGGKYDPSISEIEIDGTIIKKYEYTQSWRRANE